jgi:transposase
VTNGFRAKWPADHDATLRTTLDTARLAGGEPFEIILATIAS